MMECHHFIKFFDSSGTGQLHYTDFMQVILPCDSQYLRALVSQRQTYNVGPRDFLPDDIERQLPKLIVKELKLAVELEQLK